MLAIAGLGDQLVTIVVALIGAAGIVAGNWVLSGRHVRRIRHEVETGEGTTLAGELKDVRQDVTALGVLFGQHLVNDHDYDRLASPLERRPHRPQPRRPPNASSSAS